MIGRRFQLAVAVSGVLVLAAGLAAQEPRQRVRAELLEQMLALAKGTQVRVADRPAELIAKPVFRYDDQPRRFIDATMWIWTDSGRPVACQKIEARLHQDTGQPQWGYCFTSLAETNLAVDWPNRSYQSREVGIKFELVPGAPVPAPRTAERRRQAREIARAFSGRILQNPRTNASTEMRLLSTPLYEYTATGAELLAGAVFGFETNGTNPDLLVLVEARGDEAKPTWQFAPARMTTGGITLQYKNEKVWEAPFVSPGQGPFSNWLFFPTSRTPVEGEVQP